MNGTNANDTIHGTTGNDTISGNGGTDFLYEDEWQHYLSRRQLTRLDTAFSRDQARVLTIFALVALTWLLLKRGRTRTRETRWFPSNRSLDVLRWV